MSLISKFGWSIQWLAFFTWRYQVRSQNICRCFSHIRIHFSRIVFKSFLTWKLNVVTIGYIWILHISKQYFTGIQNDPIVGIARSQNLHVSVDRIEKGYLLNMGERWQLFYLLDRSFFIKKIDVEIVSYDKIRLTLNVKII